MSKYVVSGSFYVTMAAKDGENGSDGKGIAEIVRYYARSSSNSTAPTSWSKTPPTLTSTYRYLWSYVKTTYTDGTTESTTPAVIGVYGDTGSPGADGAQGARMEMVYWDECPVGFKFCAGVDGETVYHIVWESRTDTNLDHTTPYLCIKSYTKTASSEAPSIDSQSATNPHWRSFENLALVATDFLLSRKIRADEIDVDNLTVKHVNAVSSDGNTTCHIDGETGKLTAKNIDVSGVINCTTLKRKMISQGDITLGSISVQGGGQFILPELDYDQCVEVKVIHILITKVLLITCFECANSNVKVFKSNIILDAVYGRARTQCDVTLIGFRYPSSDTLSNVTYWKIIPQDSSDTTTEIEDLTVS